MTETFSLLVFRFDASRVYNEFRRSLEHRSQKQFVFDLSGPPGHRHVIGDDEIHRLGAIKVKQSIAVYDRLAAALIPSDKIFAQPQITCMGVPLRRDEFVKVLSRIGHGA